jgi:hypothetical protein
MRSMLLFCNTIAFQWPPKLKCFLCLISAPTHSADCGLGQNKSLPFHNIFNSYYWDAHRLLLEHALFSPKLFETNRLSSQDPYIKTYSDFTAFLFLEVTLFCLVETAYFINIVGIGHKTMQWLLSLVHVSKQGESQITAMDILTSIWLAIVFPQILTICYYPLADSFDVERQKARWKNVMKGRSSRCLSLSLK